MLTLVFMIISVIAFCCLFVYFGATGRFKMAVKSDEKNSDHLIPEPESVQWYREAAEQGDVHSQFLLGSCYYYGIGMKRDKVEAVKWFRIAANKGCVEAQRKMGDCYYYGEGVEESESEALKWYRQAAKNGNVFSQAFLGKCYFFGVGTPVNETEAIKWYIEAAKQGDKESITVLKRLGINPLFTDDINTGNLQDWIQQAIHRLMGIRSNINQN